MDPYQKYYQIISVIDSIFSTLIIAYCCVIWTRPFLDHRKKAWMTGGAYAVTMLVLNFMPWYISGILAHLIGALVVFVVMSLTDKKYLTQKLFIAITFFCLRWQAPRIVVYINNEIYAALYHFITPVDHLKLWFFLTVIITFIGYDLLIFLLLYNAVKCILWSYGRKREDMDGKEFLLLSMPSFSGMVSYVVIRYYDFIYERDVGKSVYDLYGSHDFIMTLFTLLSFAVILVTTYVFRQWKTKQEENRQREIFSTQMTDLQSHIGEMEQLYRDMRSLRHDMGNHLVTLKQLYDRGEYDAAQQYADRLNEEITNTSFPVNSGNPVTDVILSARKKEMEEKGIAFSCDFHYPLSETVDSFDISIILNNALSNAIEAIEREKSGMQGTAHISLFSERRKNMYLIIVANSFRGNLEIDPVSGLPRTTKDGEGHGFGLSAIRHAARKYLGDMEITSELFEGEKCCVLRVMLQLPAFTTDNHPPTTSAL